MKKSYHSIVAPIEEAIATRVTECAATSSAREPASLGFFNCAPLENLLN
jgi:hypothetical protein